MGRLRRESAAWSSSQGCRQQIGAQHKGRHQVSGRAARLRRQRHRRRAGQFANLNRQVGACITSQMIGAGPRIRALASLMNLRGTPQIFIDEFNKKISAQIESVGGQRNRYLHDQLFMDTQTKQVARLEITANRQPRFGFVAISPTELDALAIQTDALEFRLRQFISQAVAGSPPWPENSTNNLRIFNWP